MIPIKDIDNELPTQEEVNIIKNSVCEKCGGKYQDGDRAIFIHTDKKLIWWHAMNHSRIYLYGLRSCRQSLEKTGINHKKYYKECETCKNLFKVKRIDARFCCRRCRYSLKIFLCRTCKKRFKVSNNYPYCSYKCRWNTIPRETIQKEFLGL